MIISINCTGFTVCPNSNCSQMFMTGLFPDENSTDMSIKSYSVVLRHHHPNLCLLV